MSDNSIITDETDEKKEEAVSNDLQLQIDETVGEENITDGFNTIDGKKYYFENGKMMEISRWEEGVERSYNGYFKYYDETNDKCIEGYYENGKRLNMIRLPEMPGYWKEYDENNNLKSICKKDKEGRYEDICYFYEDNKLVRISKWHEGKEISTSGNCVFYNEPYKTWFEGTFQNGMREGYGKA